MPEDHAGMQRRANRLTTDIDRGAYGDLTSPTREVLKMPDTGADIAKQIGEMIVGPARNGIRSQYSGIEISGARAAIDAAIPKIDMSQFLASHQKTIDASQLFNWTYAVDSPIKAYMDAINRSFNGYFVTDSQTRRGSRVDLAEKIDEIHDATAPQVIEEYKSEVFTPAVEVLIDDVATEPTDEDVEAVRAIAAEMTPDQEALAEQISQTQPSIEIKKTSAVQRLSERLPNIDKKRIGHAVLLLAIGGALAVLVLGPGAGAAMLVTGSVGFASLLFGMFPYKKQLD